VEGTCISASIGLRFGLQFFDNLHLPQVHHSDGVVVGIRGVELLELRNVLHSFGTGRVRDRRNDFVRAEIADVRLPCGEVRGQHIMIVVINREVVKALASRSWQVELGDRPERLAEYCCCERATEKKQSTNCEPDGIECRLHDCSPKIATNHGAVQFRPRPHRE